MLAAIAPGRRMTQRENRYQKPLSSPPASRCIAARQRSGASALTRGPSAASSAGRIVSATVAAISVTRTPPIPIE